VPVEKRLDLLAHFRSRIFDAERAPLDLGELSGQQSLPAEKVLLARVEESLEVLGQFSAADQGLIRQVLGRIISGQELDLRRFSGTAAGEVRALDSEADLDDYTYRVAGCVGEFWTLVCRAHLAGRAAVDDEVQLHNGVRFGKGLQLVNILRDLPRDLRQGRCYIPRDPLAAQGLVPEDLLDPGQESKFRPVYDAHLALARGHLEAGWAYTNALPRGQWRVRLACAWPVLIGVKTLRALRAGAVLDPAVRIKISRREIRQVMTRTLLVFPFERLWREQFELSDQP
jgi:farnesyl-diphosphate farnesyltransferase